MRNEIVLDLETKKAPSNWGERDLASVGISVVGTWNSAGDRFRVFRESHFAELGALLKNADRVIGFFITKFDLPVLQPYMDFDLRNLPVLDIFDDVTAKLGHRVSLASLAKATLNAEKGGHGLDAVRWYQEGNWEKLEAYCTQDVRLTRDLYHYGRDRGHLLFESFVDGKTVSVPVSWGMADEADVVKLIEQARAEQRVLEIDYVSRENAGEGFLKKRKIEIRGIRGDDIEAFDHLRQDVRNFRIGRIVAARLLDEAVQPRPVAQSLFRT
ncbi:MAG: WYL domain-containing protein [Candidatus Sungbacteria bacterium]|uniref:WYL domain-containing protein n=1 Tax=Candidatus Sungiibacteriota bacterium TaxID=2750080 RepID=A0A933DTN1_9BACT|nr:WYL domain-containing protein [Candidatus Sungbacteria bacterium]